MCTVPGQCKVMPMPTTLLHGYSQRFKFVTRLQPATQLLAILGSKTNNVTGTEPGALDET